MPATAAKKVRSEDAYTPDLSVEDIRFSGTLEPELFNGIAKARAIRQRGRYGNRTHAVETLQSRGASHFRNDNEVGQGHQLPGQG